MDIDFSLPLYLSQKAGWLPRGCVFLFVRVVCESTQEFHYSKYFCWQAQMKRQKNPAAA